MISQLPHFSFIHPNQSSTEINYCRRASNTPTLKTCITLTRRVSSVIYLTPLLYFTNLLSIITINSVEHIYAERRIICRVFTAPFTQFPQFPLFHIPQDQELKSKIIKVHWPPPGSPNTAGHFPPQTLAPAQKALLALQAAGSSHFMSQLKGHFPQRTLF